MNRNEEQSPDVRKSKRRANSGNLSCANPGNPSSAKGATLYQPSPTGWVSGPNETTKG